MSNRIEYKIFTQWIPESASVLDLGCGAGELLAFLIREKQVSAQGVELDEQAILCCVSKGLSVYQQDIDTGLSDYADNSFDYVILNQTLQQVKKPVLALQEALRVGKKVIIGFPNFAHCTVRISIFFKGRVPVTSALPFEWYDTPNLHFLSINDFKEYCKKENIQIERSFFKSKNKLLTLFPNVFAEFGFFLLSKKSQP